MSVDAAIRPAAKSYAQRYRDMGAVHSLYGVVSQIEAMALRSSWRDKRN